MIPNGRGDSRRSAASSSVYGTTDASRPMTSASPTIDASPRTSTASAAPKGASATAETVLRHGDLALDLRTRRVTVGQSAVDLSAREFALAEQFLQHPEQVLSREQLLSRVWGFDFDPGSNVVDVYVRYLRGKIGADRIETVRGMGYRLV